MRLYFPKECISKTILNIIINVIRNKQKSAKRSPSTQRSHKRVMVHLINHKKHLMLDTYFLSEILSMGDYLKSVSAKSIIGAMIGVI